MLEPGEGVTLDDGREYVCAECIEQDGKNYVYLGTLEEPTTVCFAEQAMVDDRLRIRVVSEKEEKLKVFAAFQAKIRSAFDQSEA